MKRPSSNRYQHSKSWLIEALLTLCDFTQVKHRASSQSKHHLVAGEFSSPLVHGSQLVFSDIPKGTKRSTFDWWELLVFPK
jgi:hypothetical protein